METLNLGIKFVKGWEEPTTSMSQTGDFTLFFVLMILGIIIAGVCFLVQLRHRKYCYSARKTSLTKNNFLKFNLMQKLTIAIAVVILFAVVISCLLIGVGSSMAIAHTDTDNSSLTPDKSEIQAVVEQDGSITLDTCTLTNTYTNKLQLQSSMVSIGDDAKEVKALENCEITITAGNETTIYSGNPNGVPQCIYDFILDSND